MSSDKQLHYSARTFDIVPHTIRPRNLILERGLFNQVSETEFKQPENLANIKQTLNTYDASYVNPYTICQNDFCDDPNYNTRKVDKRNRTDILGERLAEKTKYIHQLGNNNKYLGRFSSIDQKNPKSQDFKKVKVNDNITFKEFLEFKKKMALHDGKAKF